eukprot:CAMPEP_0197648762 /NCGR_PEP_ID=MMETSP1338-20131121/27945_1 /TAXON_ID=43686 ORGANISM="Pelagodinium beii, Strain RCC1491" /NCGR_SAMPLE_ID=MMETSP1338 /ASSEMBLY_ACC=CAM_ASM_000754 /LENGTH=734 /DNA_ID=CAMNT_0043222815 /DNA_START=75 /DNA_END=2279 /DNA_ORIENTATION=-
MGCGQSSEANPQSPTAAKPTESNREEAKPLVSSEATNEEAVVEQPVLVEAAQPLESKSQNKETQKLINKIVNGEDFFLNRWRCVEKPDRAYYTLGPYAQLQLELVEARNLIPSSTSGFDKYWQDEPDAFVKVLVDDTLKYQTKTVNNSRAPKWSQDPPQKFDIIANKTMVRLHVYDSDSSTNSELVDPLGFVEFCVGDMPFDQEIEGWLELRFPANLQGTNLERFAEHCERREESLGIAGKKHRDKKDKGDLETGGAAPEEERDVSKKVKTHVPSSLASRAMKQARIMGSKAASVVTGQAVLPHEDDNVQYNAGEIHVKMKLVQVTQDPVMDSLYAHALTPSYCTYATFVQEEVLPQLDLQELVDDVIDIKIKLLDDICFACYTFVMYILSWRSFVLSGTLLLAILSAAKSGMLAYGILHIWVAVCLLYLSKEDWRNELTTGGLNAPLNQEGYELVAAWDKTNEMFNFLMRIIQARLGEVLSQQDLVHFAGTLVCEVGGKPDVSYDEILKVLHDVWFLDLPHASKLHDAGDLVRVKERRRGEIMKLEGPDGPNQKVTVKFDEKDWDTGEDDMEGIFLKKEVFPRTDIPGIPRALVPKSVKALLATVQYQVNDVKEQVLPILSVLKAFFTWKYPLYMSAVIVFLIARASMSFIGFMDEESWAHFIIAILSGIRNGILGLAVIAALFSQSRGVRIAIGLFNMLKSKISGDPRPAPENWKFFKPVSEPYSTPVVSQS